MNDFLHQVPNAIPSDFSMPFYPETAKGNMAT